VLAVLESIGSPELIAAISALAIAVVELYRRLQSNVERITIKLDKCEERHVEREVEMREMAVRIAQVEGENRGIEMLAKQVIDVVSKHERH